MPAVKHIALIKFKTETTTEQIDQIFEKLLDLSETVPDIVDYVAGVNDSPENLNQGYTHGFVMTFKDAAARDAYLPHPGHEHFKAGALPFVDSVIIVDFEI